MGKRAVEIDGVAFESLTAAGRAKGVGPNAVREALARGTLHRLGTGRVGPAPAPVTIRGRTYPDAQAAADDLGVAVATVRDARCKGRLDRVGLKPLRNVDGAEFARLWARADLTREDIAALFGCTPQAVAWRAKADGLPSRKRNRMSYIDDAAFRRLWLARVSAKEISAFAGYAHPSAVGARANLMGLPRRRKTGGVGARGGWPPTITLAQFFAGEIARLRADLGADDRAELDRIEALPDSRWSAGQDHLLVRGLAAGAGVAAVAAELAETPEAVAARWRALVPVASLENQARVVRVVRLRAQAMLALPPDRLDFGAVEGDG
jgi:hypothetical protein